MTSTTATPTSTVAGPGTALLLKGLTLPGRTGTGDVLINDGRIVAIAEGAGVHPEADTARRLDLSGHVLLAAAVETHAHLDKALLGNRAANPGGDLAGAIEANRRVYPSLTREDIRVRALAALDIAVRRGYTVVRTHANLEEGLGLTAVEVLLEIAEEVTTAVEVQVVGLVGCPLTGPEGAAARRLVHRAIEAGVHVVGGAPWLDARPHQAVRWLVDCAADAGLPIDLHLDETLDPASTSLMAFTEQVSRRGLGGRAVASHCVSLGQQDPAAVAATARTLADTGIAVVTLPQTNLSLQGRDLHTRVPRAMTPIGMLREAGVRVAGGSDNWRDMFNPLGRIDPFETAALLASAGHLPPDAAYDCVSTEARRVVGLDPAGIAVGAPAELLAVRAGSVVEAIAAAPDERTVIHRGRVVAHTHVTVERDFTWHHH